MNNKVVVIVGPTAVGKTKIAIELAKKFNGQIISADSMQVYKRMDIGTAKPSIDEMEGILHYMIDVLEPDEEFSVASYKEMAVKCIDECLAEGKVPLLAGGTGLYINSIVDNIEFSETIADWEYRKRLEEKASFEGTEALYKELKEVDYEAACRIHPNDLRRIIRALEVYKCTGKPISYHRKISQENPSKYDFVMIGLNMDRSELYKRIDLRVDKMIEQGLLKEVKSLVKEGINADSTAMQGLGYKEMLQYIKGENTLEDTIEVIKRDSRRYAKRQITWFKRDERICWFDVGEGMEIIIKKISNYLEANRIFI